ncbi:MAG: alpha/beta fold hydrolase [Actinomycetaceae bacterium]|nr:alpha/beta fold hydrolase [Actinomycetaceae bacterium]
MTRVLSYEITGPIDGPPLVLGSSLGSDRHMWDEILPALSNYRVLRYDFPGHGLSELLNVDGPATVDDLGESILATATDAGFDRFHIAGLSLGGMMSLWMAINHPERIQSMTMMCSGPVILPPSDWTAKATNVRAHGTQSLVEATLKRWYTERFLADNDYRVERTRTTFVACQDEGYAQCCEVIASMDNRPGLQTISVPVRIIHAEYDQSLPPHDARELAENIAAGPCPSVTTSFISDAAHMAAVEQPEQVATALLSGLESV